MTTLKESMNEAEKMKYESFRQRMLDAPTYAEIFFFGWRAKRILKQSKRRILNEMEA